MAFAAQDKSDLAQKEADAIAALGKELGSEAAFGPFNKAAAIFSIAENHVRARVALSKRDYKNATELLEAVVPVEDKLRYMEPPDWYIYTREALGGVLLSAGRYSEAEGVFRKDLEKNRRKGRALYGLQASLKKQGNDAQARFVERGFKAAWENADTTLTPASIWWLAKN